MFPARLTRSARALLAGCALAAIARPLNAEPGPANPRTEAMAAMARKDFPGALKILNPALAENPKDGDLLALRASAYYAEKEYKLALVDSNAAISLLPHPPASAYFGRGLEYIATHQTDEAIADFSECIVLAPEQTAARKERAELYLQKKEWDPAIEDLNFAINKEPHNFNLLLNRAQGYQHKNAFAEAEEDIDECILINGSYAPLFLVRGRLAYRFGEYKKAKADFEQALRLDPKSAHEKNALAWFLATCPDASLRDPDRAVELANDACLEFPRNYSYIDTQAAAFAAHGDFDLAIKSQQYAVKLCNTPTLPELQKHLDAFKQNQLWIDADDAKEIAWDRTRFDSFDVVWKTVDAQYYDASVTGANWRMARDKYRLPLSNAKNDEELRRVLQLMLSELHRSHFAIIPRSTAVFHPEERGRQGTSGTQVAVVGESIYISQVEPKSAGNRAQLIAGEQIVAMEGEDVATMYKSLLAAGLTSHRAGLYIKEGIEARLSGPVNQAIKLTVIGLDKKRHEVAVSPLPFDGIWSEPAGNFPSEPILMETKRDRDGIAYARFNIFALPVVKPLKTFFKSLKANDGLIIDLRGNPGGSIIIAPGLCGWLCTQKTTIGLVQLRDEQVPLNVYPQNGAFTGPIAVLIDGCSASTSEIFSSGLRDLGRAKIFGTQSAGAALPSLYRRLPNGDLFQYAIGDIHTQRGTTLEGSGVKPDTESDYVREDLVKGHDPVLDQAKAWLKQARKKLPSTKSIAER